MNLVFIFLGFAGLLAQVLYLREMAILFQGHELILSFCLSAWLLWVGLGSRHPSAPDPNNARQRLALILSYLGIMMPLTAVFIRLSTLTLAAGMIPHPITSFIFPFVLLAPVCWGLGQAFKWGLSATPQNASRIYFLESVGATLAGLFCLVILGSDFSSFRILSIIGFMMTLVGGGTSKVRSRPLVLCAVIWGGFVCGTSAWWDNLTRSYQWRDYDEIMAQRETRYEHLLIARHINTRHLFQNGSLTSHFPDPASQEELVHWPLLSHPHPKQVLAIGVPSLFSLTEIREHPVEAIDVVDGDQQAMVFVNQHLPSFAGEHGWGITPQIHAVDPRQWLLHRPQFYDVIIQSHIDPSNASLNRYFTKEFFKTAQMALKTNGILAFSISSSENYLSPEIAMVNSSIVNAAKFHFPYMEMVPGSRLTILASSQPLKFDPSQIRLRLSERKIKNQAVVAETIPFLLDSSRRQFVWGKLDQIKDAMINSDFRPISYGFLWRVWLSKFASPNYFIFPLVLAGLLVWGFRRAWLVRRGWEITPEHRFLFLIGMGGMMVDVTSLLLFQSLSGALYWHLGLLNASFMLGLTAGSGWVSHKIFHQPRRALAGLMGGGSLLFVAFGFNVNQLTDLPAHHHLFIFILILFITGGVVGMAYPLAAKNASPQSGGPLYSADLWGSALGAFLAGAIFVPIMGSGPTLVFTGLLLAALGIFPSLMRVLRKSPS